MPFGTLVNFFENLIKEVNKGGVGVIPSKNESDLLKPSAKGKEPAIADSKEQSTGQFREIGRKPVAQASCSEIDPLLCRLLADGILHSYWNRDSATKAGEISYSGLEAFISLDLIRMVENKLRYLVMLEKDVKSNSKEFLVHVYR
jgi:hypothetical protein